MRRRPVPDAVLRLAARQRGLVSTAQCRQEGLSADRIATLVRSGAWRRVTRGVLDVTGVAPSSLSWDDRHRRAAWAGLLAVGPSAVAVGCSALALLGVEGLPARVTAQVALPHGASARSHPGVALRQFDAGLRCVEVGGRLVAAPEWALAQAVPELDRGAAVACMDSALRSGLLDRQMLERSHDLSRGRRGVERTHGWWQLSDGRAESPLETMARLDCVDVGIPPDELQVPILDAHGRLLGRGDLGWRQQSGRWLVGEVDGRSVHELPSALLHDRHRQNAFWIDGCADVLRFTLRDVAIAGQVGRTVKAALARGGRVG